MNIALAYGNPAQFQGWFANVAWNSTLAKIARLNVPDVVRFIARKVKGKLVVRRMIGNEVYAYHC